MAKMALLKQASEKTGLSEWELSSGARSGKYPAMRVGGIRGRWAFDLDLLNARIEELMLLNLKEDAKEVNRYSKLRKIGG